MHLSHRDNISDTGQLEHTDTIERQDFVDRQCLAHVHGHGTGVTDADKGSFTWDATQENGVYDATVTCMVLVNGYVWSGGADGHIW